MRHAAAERSEGRAERRRGIGSEPSHQRNPAAAWRKNDRSAVVLATGYCASAIPTSMYCPPAVCFTWTAIVFFPGVSAAFASGDSGTSTYSLV